MDPGGKGAEKAGSIKSWYDVLKDSDLTKFMRTSLGVPASVAGLDIDNRYVYVTDDKGAVHALDRNSGASIWKQDKLALRSLSRPLALGGGRVAVADYQGVVHLLALGGYALPLACCARSGAPLDPPLGNWEWRCSLLPGEGFVIGGVAGAQLVLNASELALLQRLLRPALPRRRDGELMGPLPVWLRLLQLVELWSREHLGRNPRCWRLLRQCFADGSADRGDGASS